MNTEEKRLTIFLYELMRDELPIGVVESIIQNADREANKTTSSRSKLLEELANRYARRLLRTPP